MLYDPWRKFFAPKKPEPEAPPKEPSRLDLLAESIANEEFGGGCIIQIVHGINPEEKRVIRTKEGKWLAEIGYCPIRQTYFRTLREYHTDPKATIHG